jgi:hypothetical protein
MNKNKLKKLCEMALETSYPSLKILDFEMVPTFKYDESQNEWIDDSFSIFIQVKMDNETLDQPKQVEGFLESLLGFDCCLDFA